MRVAIVCSLLLFSAVLAKDPAPGWLGYAVGTSPNGGRLTHMEAKWKVGNNPTQGGAFFSPWFGIETSDNLNLIQPVNPWMGNQWEIYNEYYQWVPSKNLDSDSHVVQPGDVLWGSVTYDPSAHAYNVQHTDLNDGWTVKSTFAIQRHGFDGDYKNYTIAYIVYEKVASCSQYPPEGEVVFYDIQIQYDGETVKPNWSTGYVENVCNNRAHVVNSTTIQITWQTS